MKIRVFKIHGKFQNYGCYSKLPADFAGYFVMDDDSREIKGYLIDKQTSYNPIRYICGVYDEDSNKLIYLQLTNDSLRFPLLFVFPDLTKEGVWTNYCVKIDNFFQYGYTNGKAKIAIKEISESNNEFLNKILKKYNEVLDVGLQLNMKLIKKGVEQYMNYAID